MTRVLKLHPDDNVVVALCLVPKGATINVGDAGENHEIVTRDEVSLAHKIAIRSIRKGELVFKYGMPIGEATTYVAAGAHVHIHNMASRYTATHYRAEDAGLSPTGETE